MKRNGKYHMDEDVGTLSSLPSLTEAVVKDRAPISSVYPFVHLF